MPTASDPPAPSVPASNGPDTAMPSVSDLPAADPAQAQQPVFPVLNGGEISTSGPAAPTGQPSLRARRGSAPEQASGVVSGLVVSGLVSSRGQETANNGAAHDAYAKAGDEESDRERRARLVQSLNVTCPGSVLSRVIAGDLRGDTVDPLAQSCFSSVSLEKGQPDHELECDDEVVDEEVDEEDVEAMEAAEAAEAAARNLSQRRLANGGGSHLSDALVCRYIDDELTDLSWLHSKDLLSGIADLQTLGGSDDDDDSGVDRKESPSSGGRGHSGGGGPVQHPTHIPYNPMKHVKSKPPYSFSCLIFMAIESSQDKKLPVKDIYSWILSHFPYYQNAPTGWKNSVRHNLSLNKFFKRVDKDRGSNIGKGSYWCIEDQDSRMKLLQAVRRTPYYPYQQLQMTAISGPNMMGHQSVRAFAGRPHDQYNRLSSNLFPYVSRQLDQMMKEEEQDFGLQEASSVLCMMKKSGHSPGHSSRSMNSLNGTRSRSLSPPEFGSFEDRRRKGQIYRGLTFQEPLKPDVLTPIPNLDHSYCVTAATLKAPSQDPSPGSSIDGAYDFEGYAGTSTSDEGEEQLGKTMSRGQLASMPGNKGVKRKLPASSEKAKKTANVEQQRKRKKLLQQQRRKKSQPTAQACSDGEDNRDDGLGASNPRENAAQSEGSEDEEQPLGSPARRSPGSCITGLNRSVERARRIKKSSKRLAIEAAAAEKRQAALKRKKKVLAGAAKSTPRMLAGKGKSAAKKNKASSAESSFSTASAPAGKYSDPAEVTNTEDSACVPTLPPEGIDLQASNPLEFLAYAAAAAINMEGSGMSLDGNSAAPSEVDHYSNAEEAVADNLTPVPSPAPALKAKNSTANSGKVSAKGKGYTKARAATVAAMKQSPLPKKRSVGRPPASKPGPGRKPGKKASSAPSEGAPVLVKTELLITPPSSAAPSRVSAGMRRSARSNKGQHRGLKMRDQE